MHITDVNAEHPQCPLGCPVNLSHPQSLSPRNNSDLARSLVAWEEAWELGNDFLVPVQATALTSFFLGGRRNGVPHVGCAIK